MENLPRYFLGTLRAWGQKPWARGSNEVAHYKPYDLWLAKKNAQRETEFLWNSDICSKPVTCILSMLATVSLLSS